MVPNFVKRGNQREVGKVFFNGSGAIYESGEPDPFAASSINCGGGRAGGRGADEEEVWESYVGLFGKASN